MGIWKWFKIDTQDKGFLGFIKAIGILRTETFQDTGLKYYRVALYETSIPRLDHRIPDRDRSCKNKWRIKDLSMDRLNKAFLLKGLRIKNIC